LNRPVPYLSPPDPHVFKGFGRVEHAGGVVEAYVKVGFTVVSPYEGWAVSRGHVNST